MIWLNGSEWPKAVQSQFEAIATTAFAIDATRRITLVVGLLHWFIESKIGSQSGCKREQRACLCVRVCAWADKINFP